jgi:hypothetical protein
MDSKAIAISEFAHLLLPIRKMTSEQQIQRENTDQKILVIGGYSRRKGDTGADVYEMIYRTVDGSNGGHWRELIC